MTSKVRIRSVAPVAGQLALQVEFGNRKRYTVELAEYIRSFPVLEPLADPERFREVQLGDWGFDVTWGDDLELAATTLHRLALEQAGEVMPTQAFKQWLAANRLSLSTTAIELGFTRRLQQRRGADPQACGSGLQGLGVRAQGHGSQGGRQEGAPRRRLMSTAEVCGGSAHPGCRFGVT